MLDWNPPKLTKASSAIGYHAEHAPIVHNGAQLKSGGSIPPAPWMATTVDELKPPKIVVSEISDSAIHQAFQEFVEDVAGQMQNNLRDRRWYHPRGTQRRNGQYIPPGLRDKVDTGKLLNSQEVRHG
ncbi:hypothetical protein SPB21_04135 [Leptothoe sp. ISB3NOV94-8A]